MSKRFTTRSESIKLSQGKRKSEFIDFLGQSSSVSVPAFATKCDGSPLKFRCLVRTRRMGPAFVFVLANPNSCGDRFDEERSESYFLARSVWAFGRFGTSRLAKGEPLGGD